MRPYKKKGQGKLSDLQYKQRLDSGFKPNPNYSGEWTTIRIRPEDRDAIKAKYGSLRKAIDLLLSGGINEK